MYTSVQSTGICAQFTGQSKGTCLPELALTFNVEATRFDLAIACQFCSLQAREGQGRCQCDRGQLQDLDAEIDQLTFGHQLRYVAAVIV